MQITPNEIDTIEEAGILNSAPVKLIRTKGGFFIAVGNANGREEALAAGSHPAIVKYNLEKKFPGFQPSMMKSEQFAEAQVERHSHFLSDELRKSGHDVYSLQNGVSVEFHVTKHGSNIGKVDASIENNALVVKGMNVSKEFSRALAGATAEKALSCGVAKVRIEK